MITFWTGLIIVLFFLIIGGVISEFIIESKARRLMKERDHLNLKTAYGRQQRDRINKEIDRLYGFK